jgi:hypothetical protein
MTPLAAARKGDHANLAAWLQTLGAKSKEELK